MINMIGYFGMMSSAFAIVTIQMMLVNGKTKEIESYKDTSGIDIHNKESLIKKSFLEKKLKDYDT